MICRQAKLKCENRHMVTWIESGTYEGDSVKFKGDERWWLIEKTYPYAIEKAQINHDWKVGGLGK